MAAIWFTIAGVSIVAGAVLLGLARRRPVRRDEPEEEPPFDLFRES